MKHDFADLNDFITHEFTDKAVEALAIDSTAEDAAVARKLLDNDSTRSAALRIIEAHGAASDVERLLEIARVTYGDDRITALKAIRRWTSDKLATARLLISAEGRDLRLAGLGLVRDVGDPQALPFLEALISHEDEHVRLTAVGLLRLRLDAAQLEELLGNYTGKGTYYYNVVTWLDRLLHAPKPLADHYRARMDEKLREVTL